MASNTYNITPKRLNSDGDYDTINFNTIADDVYFNNTNSATSYATYGLPCLTSTQNQGTTAELAYYTRTGWFPMPSGVGLTVDAWNSTTRILSAYNTTTVLTAVDGNYYMNVGDKIKFTGTTDNSTYYGIITGVRINGTSLYYSIFFGQNVSSYAGGAPKNIYYSKQKSPTGFPQSGWYLELSSTTETSVALSENQIINIGSLSLTVPIGEWKISYSVSTAISQSGTQSGTYCIGRFSLSTSSTAEQANGTAFQFGEASTAKPFQNMAIKSKNITLTANTTYYLLFKALASVNTVFLQGTTTEPTIIRAECAYI